MSGDTLAHFLINRYVDARTMGGENVCVCVYTNFAHTQIYSGVNCGKTGLSANAVGQVLCAGVIHTVRFNVIFRKVSMFCHLSCGR